MDTASKWETIRNAIIISIQFTLVSLLSYLIAVFISSAIEGDSPSSLIGGLWAVISGIVVTQATLVDTKSSALLRILGSFIGAVFSALYLLVLPVNPLGVAILIGITVFICQAISIPSHGRLAAITVAVVMIVSAVNPEINPVLNAALRFADSVIGSLIALLVIRMWPHRGMQESFHHLHD